MNILSIILALLFNTNSWRMAILEALYYCVEKYREPNSLAKLRSVSAALKVNKIINDTKEEKE